MSIKNAGPVLPNSMASHMAQYPKHGSFGTLIPNRIFVGGIASDTTENELKHFFSTYGAVKDCKIILDRGGLSKSYGFVTFETSEDANKVIKRMADGLILRERKLNIGPAIRKQGVSRIYGDSSVAASGGAYLYPSATPYTYPNGGVTLICTPDGYLVPAHPQQTLLPSVMSSFYNQPNYYNSPPGATAAQWTSPNGQWRWASQGPAATMMSPQPYVYPVQMTVLSPEMVYAQNMQCHQNTETSDL